MSLYFSSRLASGCLGRASPSRTNSCRQTCSIVRPRVLPAVSNLNTYSCKRIVTLSAASSEVARTEYQSGYTLAVHSEAQINKILADHKDKLVVAMCKSTTCKPCKAFMPTYHMLAERFPDFVLLEITGDGSPELRSVMKAWQIKTTPTFRMYRGGEVVNSVSGTRDNKLLNALLEQLKPGERGADWSEVTQEEFPNE